MLTLWEVRRGESGSSIAVEVPGLKVSWRKLVALPLEEPQSQKRAQVCVGVGVVLVKVQASCTWYSSILLVSVQLDSNHGQQHVWIRSSLSLVDKLHGLQRVELEKWSRPYGVQKMLSASQMPDTESFTHLDFYFALILLWSCPDSSLLE